LINNRYFARAAGLLVLGCTDTPQQPSDSRSPRAALEAAPAILVGAGDIAGCPSSYKDEATAKLLDGIPGTVFTLGDNVYEDGTAAEYRNCYGPSWGRHRARTRPAIGNHEYHVSGATGYFGYFGSRARPAGLSYYSYNLGAWHIVVLDSERKLGDQATWLKADLAANPRRCTLAYWHQPYFTTGDIAPKLDLQRIFGILYRAGAEVVISGHNHIYERFQPQTPEGVIDLARGIRYFVVGTGGAPLLPMRARTPALQVRQNTAHGVLKLSLYATRYEWKFISVAGKTFTDSGGSACH
jgi:hypothetical protein